MKHLLTIIGLLTISYSLTAQTYEYVYRNELDSSVNCYLKVIPDTIEVIGLIVRDFSSLPDTSKESTSKLHLLAAENGLMTIFTVTTERFPELYYFDKEPALLDEIIHETITKHNIPDTAIFIGGMSASGTRALRFVQYCKQGKSKFNTSIRGVFAVDSPLDLERFYNSSLQHRKYFKKGMLWEADLILDNFPAFIGTPHEDIQKYRRSSVFSHTDTTLGNAVHFLNTSILFFHEPDIDWWMHERGATYYDINSFDITGFVNKQISNGNTDIELITTTQKGYDRSGQRNCHSWTIVDEEYLTKWIIQRISTASN